jgi:hypothetical protein
MACDADIPTRQSPMANAEAARSFIGLPFLFKSAAKRRWQRLKNCDGQGSPVAAVPVMAVPVTVAPAPMTMTPMAVVMPTPVVPVMSPPHFFRCDPIDFVARGHRGMGVFMAGKTSAVGRRLRQKRRGLRACRQRGGSGRKSKGEFQEIPAFHDVFLLESE